MTPGNRPGALCHLTFLSPVYACDHLFKRASPRSRAARTSLFANAVRAKTSPADGSVTSLGSYSPPASVRGPDSHKRFARQAGSVRASFGVSGNGLTMVSGKSAGERTRLTGWRAVTPRRHDGNTVSTRDAVRIARGVSGVPPHSPLTRRPRLNKS